MISIIIPVLNEKKNIKPLSRKLIKLKKVNQIIFVDDNSNDGTYEEIRDIKFTNKISAIKRKNIEKNLSLSVFEGVTKAKNNTILVMDADLQHDVSCVPKMYDIYKKKKYNLIVGSRFLDDKILGNLGLIRSFFSNIIIFLIHSLLKKKTSDPLSGFFLCDKKIILNYKKNFYLKGFKILFDIIYNGDDKIKCKDIKIKFAKRKFETSKLNYKIIYIFLKQLIYTFFKNNK